MQMAMTPMKSITRMLDVSQRRRHTYVFADWSEDVYDRMVKTLHNDEMIPANGYGGLKPLLLCDESKFVWVGRDDKDPHDPAGRPLRESRPKEMAGTKAGAWVYKKRYLVNGVKQPDTGLCRPGVFAVTLTRNDFIIFCPPSFQDPVASTKSAVDAKDSVQKDDVLDTYSATSLSRVMVHELAHWFGGAGNGGTDNRNGMCIANDTFLHLCRC
jgi:hypothetical protein